MASTDRSGIFPTALFLICGLSFAGPAQTSLQGDLEGRHGQATDDTEEVSVPVEVIYETATVWERDVADSASAITILDRSDIERLNVTTVSQLVAYVPGVFVADPGARAGLAAAQIRGGDPNFTLVLLDGVPINDATDQFGGAVNLNSLPLAEVDRIEVVRGPLSSFYGSAALAGAINIITRRGEAAQPSYELRAAGGNFSVFDGSASAAHETSRNNYFIGASWEQEAGRIGDDSFEQLNIQGRYRGRVTQTSELLVTSRVSSWQGEDYPEGSGGPVYGSGETRFSDHDEFNLGLKLQVGSESRKHQLGARIYRQDVQRESPAIGFIVPESREDSTYTRLQLSWAYPAWQNDSTQLTIGVGLDRESGDNRSDFAGFLSASYELDRTTASGIVEVTSEQGPWLLEFVGRLDSPEGFDLEFNPRVAASYRFSDHTRVRGSLARAFKLPSFFALGTPPILGGNPDLAPEIALGGDLSLEQQLLDQTLNLSLGVFYSRYEDLIDFIFDPAPMLVNRSSVRARGSELSLDWKATSRINLAGNVTWQDVEDQETSEVLRNRPEWVGSARFSWQPTSKLSWDLDARWVSERKDEQVTSDRTSVRGYLVMGTALLWKVSDTWMVDARIDNLTDRSYETFIGFPGPLRSYRLGIKYRVRQLEANTSR